MYYIFSLPVNDGINKRNRSKSAISSQVNLNNTSWDSSQPSSPSHKDDENDQFVLHAERLRLGYERRTTLMIRNIPNKYTQKMLLAAVDETSRGLYDFFYLPIDFKVCFFFLFFLIFLNKMFLEQMQCWICFY